MPVRTAVLILARKLFLTCHMNTGCAEARPISNNPPNIKIKTSACKVVLEVHFTFFMYNAIASKSSLLNFRDFQHPN